MKSCENCSSLTNGSYGSGRFCSPVCARSFSTKNKRVQINEKVSKKLKGMKNGQLANPNEIKTCLTCQTEFSVIFKDRDRKFCSRECSDKYHRITPDGVNSVVGFRQRLKLKAIEYKGGSCVCCGYNKSARSLQFHHRDPLQKDFGIGGKSLSWEKMKAELDKCELVCANCHGEIHDGLIDLNQILK